MVKTLKNLVEKHAIIVDLHNYGKNNPNCKRIKNIQILKEKYPGL